MSIDMDKIISFIEKICDILEIEVPIVLISPNDLRTKTQLAALINEDLILKNSSFTPDTAFAIAHELRHKWQIQNNYKLYFSDYKEVGTTSIEEYNLQLAEVDANAFGAVIMSSLFGIKPLFNGLPNNVKQAIFERAEFLQGVD